MHQVVPIVYETTLPILVCVIRVTVIRVNEIRVNELIDDCCLITTMSTTKTTDFEKLAVQRQLKIKAGAVKR